MKKSHKLLYPWSAVKLVVSTWLLPTRAALPACILIWQVTDGASRRSKCGSDGTHFTASVCNVNSGLRRSLNPSRRAARSFSSHVYRNNGHSLTLISTLYLQRNVCHRRVGHCRCVEAAHAASQLQAVGTLGCETNKSDTYVIATFSAVRIACRGK